METTKPSAELATRTLPRPLLRALSNLFEGEPGDAMLVGGTALAGYYAAHRRSDDIDVFVADVNTFDGFRQRVRALGALGATLTVQHT